MDVSWEGETEAVVELQAGGRGAAEASPEALQDSKLSQSERADPEVGQACAWAAGACLVCEAVQGGGDAVVVGYWGVPGAGGPLAGGPVSQEPYEVVRQVESEGVGWGEWAG